MICDRRVALDALGERLLDANRTIGQPTKMASIFGRKVTKRYRGKLEALIELPNPVIRSYYRDGSIKQYVRDHLLLRTEATSNNVRDFGVPKAIDAVPQRREAMAALTDRYQWSNKTSWRRLWTVASCANSPNPRACPLANAFPA